MSSRTKVTVLGGALPTVVILAHGCRGPTQVTLDVRTNVVCADSRGVDVVVAADAHRAEERAALVTPGSRFPSATTDECTDGPAPREVGTLVITPSGGGGAVVLVAAFGSAKLSDCVAPKLARQCIIARRRFAFVEDKQLTLPIVLDPECAGVPCNESSTCVGKKCVDSNVDCANGTCSEPGVLADGGVALVDGASPLVDAAPGDDGAIATDSGTDAGADAGSDASSDGGNDGGTLVCANGAHCLMNGGLAVSCIGTAACCYTTTPSVSCSTTCAPPSLAACCRGAQDCAPGEVCCASTPTLQADTQIYCRPAAQCQPGGRAVCSSADTDCGQFNPCNTMGSAYSAMPEFFTCS